MACGYSIHQRSIGQTLRTLWFSIYWVSICAPQTLFLTQLKVLKIGNFDTDKKVLIIAEIGNNHEGDYSLAKELVSLAAEAGADAVKFQYIIPEKLISPTDRSRIEQLNRFKLKEQDYIKLAEEANRLGMLFLCTPFDLSVIDFLKELVPAFKIASGDNNFFPLIDKIAKTGKPVITSLGLGQIIHAKQLQEYFFEKWRQHGHQNPGLGLLHCVCSYPTPMEEASIIQIDKLKSLPVTPGYSDHTLGIKACELAVARGARIIEKHFTKNKNQSSYRDHKLSADQADFRKLVTEIRLCEKIVGNALQEAILKCERSNLPLVRRTASSKRLIMKGEVFKISDLNFFRGTEFDCPIKLNGDLKALSKIKKNQIILLDRDYKIL